MGQQWHEPLKKALRAVEDQALGGKHFDAQDLNEKFALWESHLDAVSKGSSAIKSGLEKELQKLTA